MTTREPAHIEKVRQCVQQLIGTTCISAACCYLGEMLYVGGFASEAASYADQALAELKSGSYFGAEERAHRLRSMATAYQSPPDWDSVWRDMECALTVSRAQDRKPDLAISYFRYAELLQRQGERQEASLRLAEADKLFAAMDMTWWSQQAAKLRTNLLQ
jgi:hypothetical protein